MPLGEEAGGDDSSEVERGRAVQRRRREEQVKRRKMLDRRTVVDVRKIREDREKRLLEAAEGRSGSAAKEQEERKEKERKAEELMRQAMRREDDKRSAFRLNRLRGQQPQHSQQPSMEPLTSPSATLTSRLEGEEGEEVEDELEEEESGETGVEESKEQLTRANDDTFITATNDLQSPFANSPNPLHTTASATPTSRSASTRTPSTPHSTSSPRAVKAAHTSTSDDGSGLSAYTTFLQQRVRHMLVSNGIFIPVGDEGVLLVNTGHNASLAAQYALAATRPPSPAPPQFHLPSLQPPTSNFLPSSASIHLASSDERQLYELLVFLARVPLLQGCAMDVFFKLSAEVKEARFDEYEVIANEGEEAEWIFLIREGRIDTKLNLERNSLIPAAAANSTHHTGTIKPPTPTTTPHVHTPQPGSSGSGSGGGGGSNSSLRRRFYSVNTASLDVSCLSRFDLCGESVLSPARRHLTSLISMTASACYSLSVSSLLGCLPAQTLASLSLYSAYSASLISLYTALRSRYRSSYHTSVVDFRLFVEGSLRRNLRHANERSRMRKEIERLGGDGGWMRDRQASRQIRHMQLGQRRVAGGGGGWRKGERVGRGSRAEEEEKEQLVGEVAVGGGGMGGSGGIGAGVRRSVTLPPVFLSFTTLNFGDTPAYSTESSPMSSVQSRTLVLPPVVDSNANIHPALR